MSTYKRLVIGNWKLNPSSVEEAKRIARRTRLAAARLAHTEAVACPPFPFIPAAMPRSAAPHFHVGAQSVSAEGSGAHTGLVSAAMLASLGVSHAIIGHSEERARGATDEDVSRAVMRALEAGLTAVVCVGEKARDESGAHFDFIKDQIRRSLADVSPQGAAPAGEAGSRRIVLAYEPIWAIGAKEAMAPADVQEMSIFVRKAFADAFGPEAGRKACVLYGGAVNSRNAADIMTIGRVDGLLVGRESVNMPGFAELLKAVDAAA